MQVVKLIWCACEVFIVQPLSTHAIWLKFYCCASSRGEKEGMAWSLYTSRCYCSKWRAQIFGGPKLIALNLTVDFCDQSHKYPWFVWFIRWKRETEIWSKDILNQLWLGWFIKIHFSVNLGCRWKGFCRIVSVAVGGTEIGLIDLVSVCNRFSCGWMLIEDYYPFVGKD